MASSEQAPAATSSTGHLWELAPLAAFFCMTLNLRLTNSAFFPLFDGVLGVARDINVSASVVVNLAVVAAALYRPRLLSERRLSLASLGLCIAGLPLVLLALRLGQGTLVGLAAFAQGGATVWVSLLTWIACSALRLRSLLVGVPLAYALAGAAGWALQGAPTELALGLLFCCPLAAWGLARPIARPTVAAIAAGQPQADAAITRPASFLPLTNRIFVCQLLVTMATGFGLRFGAQEGALDTVLPAIVLLGLIALWNGAYTGPRRFDRLFYLAIVLVVAAFFVAPLRSYTPVTLAILSMGDACVSTVFTLVFMAAAARNPMASLSVCGWANAMASLGSIGGANIGAIVGAQQGNEGAFLVSAAVAVLLLAYVFFGLQGFSFSMTIEGIEPVQPLQTPPHVNPARIEETCSEIGRSHGLTPREIDVLALLARGRNNQFVQDELVLTRNTVKTYIKRIYAKLDVHSQQQLIDMVEQKAGRG